MMFPRKLQDIVERRLAQSPAVALIGPRQVGKTTLARTIAQDHPNAFFLDLERGSDNKVLDEPELFFAAHRDRLLILDEVQLRPELFSALRPEIDADRRPGRFLLLGSASGDLLRQSGESLAGRISYQELTPLLASELPAGLETLQTLWMRGGYPLSYTAVDDEASYAWRLDFIQTFLQRDLAALGLRLPAEAVRRFWQMLAHLQGQLFNASQLGLSLGGLNHTTTARWLDVLVDTMMVRRLQPLMVNVGKRLIKSPKVYLRDSGLLHALLGIATLKDLQGHPVAGPSWEGFVVEQVAAALPIDAQLSFYRTAAGAELDLIIERGMQRIGVEIKFSSTPKPAKGFWQALKDLQIKRAYVIAPVTRRYALAEGVEVLPLAELPSVF